MAVTISTRKRIGIFLYDWSIESFIKDLVIGLAKAGDEVDFFYKDPGHRPFLFADVTQFASCENIRFLDFTPPYGENTISGRTERLLRNRTPLIYNALINGKPDRIIRKDVLRRSGDVVFRATYDCFIGIEKKGLIWASVLSEAAGCPVIYYSLELYIEDHPELRSFYYLRKAEKKCHQRSGATIVQDELRGSVLMKANGLDSAGMVFYFPVSVPGDAVRKKSSFLHRRFGLHEKVRIVLYFGAVFAGRHLEGLAEAATGLGDGTVLMILGHGTKAYGEYLKSLGARDKIIVSTEIIPEKDVLDVVSSAHVGVALFQTAYSNDRLTAFSSHKIAYYMQCGVPVILINNESTRRLMHAFKCGELIDSTNDIPGKVSKIFNDYEHYRNQAFSAFDAFYSFDRNFPRLHAELESVMNK